jgi:hypothetical protein
MESLNQSQTRNFIFSTRLLTDDREHFLLFPSAKHASNQKKKLSNKSLGNKLFLFIFVDDMFVDVANSSQSILFPSVLKTHGYSIYNLRNSLKSKLIRFGSPKLFVFLLVVLI